MADEIISGLRIRAAAISTSIAVSAKNKLYPPEWDLNFLCLIMTLQQIYETFTILKK